MAFDIRCIISGADTGGTVAVFEEITQPGMGPPLHAHHKQVELFHVIEGTFRFTRGDETVEGRPGDSVYIPAGVPHRFENIGDTPAKLHFELMPALESEAGFEELIGLDLETADLPAFFAKYEMELLG